MSSSLRVDLDLDSDGFTTQLEQNVENWDAHREAVLIALAENLVGKLKRDAPTNTGRFKQTIRALETSGNTVPVVAGGEEGVDYTLPLIHGSKPHAPGPADPAQNRSLARWADRNDYPGGFGAIWGHIYHYGTEEHDFVTPAREEHSQESGGVAATVLRNRGVMQ